MVPIFSHHQCYETFNSKKMRDHHCHYIPPPLPPPPPGAGMLSGDMEDFGRPKGYPSQPQKHQYTDVAAAAAASTSNKEGGRVKPTGANVKKVSAQNISKNKRCEKMSGKQTSCNASSNCHHFIAFLLNVKYLSCCKKD